MKQLKITPRFTNRDSVSLEKYLTEIGKIDLLSADEEAELARRIHGGDEEALMRLTQANLRFVVSVAKQYQNQGLSLSDLINEGNMGLIKAAKRFDETMGFKFISYAVWWIRQAILQAIVEHSRIVRLPLNKASLYNKLNTALQEFLQEHERPPSNEELGAMLNLTEKEVDEIIANSPRHVSFDAPLDDEGGGSTLVDVYEGKDIPNPDNKLMNESLRRELQVGLQSLRGREREILENFFGLNNEEPMGLEEIADQIGLSRERVRQIKERAIRRLRKKVNPKVLRSYFG